ncbi:MAG: hypothetical protein ABJA94_09780 [Rhodoglobus sp.]
MYIGHFAAAAVLVTLVPDSPVLPASIGVAWPDLVWPILVLSGRESVTVDREDPLQRSVRFDSYPFSHSLVLSNLVAVLPAVIIAIAYESVIAGIVFWIASLSHWLLDLVVHKPDLPVVGFGAHDRKLGAGLWHYPKTAFVVEYLFFLIVVLITARPEIWLGVLGGGLLLHLLNANSFFGLTRNNPLGTPARLATVTLVGYLAAIFWFTSAWQ